MRFCHFVPVLFAFVVLGLFSSVLSPESARMNVSEMTYFVLSTRLGCKTLSYLISARQEL